MSYEHVTDGPSLSSNNTLTYIIVYNIDLDCNLKDCFEKRFAYYSTVRYTSSHIFNNGEMATYYYSIIKRKHILLLVSINVSIV